VGVGVGVGVGVLGLYVLMSSVFVLTPKSKAFATAIERICGLQKDIIRYSGHFADILDSVRVFPLASKCYFLFSLFHYALFSLLS
jgi:hypothetical protein